LSAAVLLGACAHHPLPDVAANAPSKWFAPLPHNGQVADLTRWWDQFNDPLLTRLIGTAQDVSPTLATAKARIETARATRAQATGTLLPNLYGQGSATRGRQDLQFPVATTASAGLGASWELDFFGGVQAARDAASARLEGAQANWHAARVSAAAEVASTYLALRACEALVMQTEADTTSRGETARLTELSRQAGFQSPANAALTRASAAEGAAQLSSRRASCDLQVKALVALTGLDEAALRTELAANRAVLPKPAQIDIASVPGAVLNQRPDLYIAALDVVAASADVSQARAQLLPRVTLAGSIGRGYFESSGTSIDGSTWAIGPLQIMLPLFDGGARRANVDAARARYDEAGVLYRAKVRSAVREVEEALVQLQSANERSENARIAADGYDDSYRAIEALQRGGLGSLLDLEQSRRSALIARSTRIDVEREQVAAWIMLYRALGGGWTPPDEARATVASGQ
jgi:NodT family efflux transporter outer membrane factor (OMF) lipoprotein